MSPVPTPSIRVARRSTTASSITSRSCSMRTVPVIVIGFFGYRHYREHRGSERLHQSTRHHLGYFDGNRLTSYVCISQGELDGQPYCLYEQSRAWDLLKITDSRLYVHETLTVTAIGISRASEIPSTASPEPTSTPYSITTTSAMSTATATPTMTMPSGATDETEWADSNNNGIGDNNDPANL